MAFSQSTVSNVRWSIDGGGLWVAWDSSSPAGTIYQVYLDGALAWSGTRTHCALAPPRGRVRVDVGTVAAGEGSTSFAGDLPARPARRVRLTWPGADGVAGYRVYQSPTAGAAVGTTPVARLAADGGAGSSYSWTSADLGRGDWSFAVTAVDQVGDESIAATASATIAGPPKPPARNAAGDRLTYTYDPATGVAALSWLPPES
ncbi:hypothetical protein [Paludisphaera rhizosphaerae]|uniref:hypothetical protein n=1 Tax=Paludisphaera rhizosphaerae TaxID=2711216 RepID=UPI0013EB314B|nr:hypothetical protein [Paludisphaera rhizosphaerae]